MSGAWAWLKKWGWVLLVGLGAVGALLLRPRRAPLPSKVMRNELDAIHASETIARVDAEKGRAEALAHVEADYGAHRAALETTEHLEAKQLESDPAALARLLVRAGARKRDG